jgi:hypothetical protein
MSDRVSTNTFTGITQDTSKAKFKADKYYDALNIRVITNLGLSTGAIETTKGTKLDFVLPNIPETIYEVNGETGSIIVPEQTNLKIVGSTSINNKVIIFSHGNASDQIWMFEYDESTDEIIGINTNKELNVSTHLKYNRDLNFSLDNRIKAIAREESNKFLRVYWVDGGRNDLRSINLYNTNSLNIPVRTLDLQPEVNMELPLLKEIINGNLPNGRIQYFYRLITKDGTITNYSPLSQLIDLNNGDIGSLSGNYPEVFDADDLDLQIERDKKERIEFSSDKGIVMKLPNAVDKDYDYIQWGYILYKEKNVPECYLFPEQYLINNNNGSKTSLLIHTGNDEKSFPISIEEINNIYNVFKNPATLTTKINKLFVADVDNEVYTSQALDNFDARSYRYHNTIDKGSKLYEADGSYYIINSVGEWTYYTSGDVVITSGINWSIPETADCINESNDESNYIPDWLYKSNGTTLGGSGKYVSYNFKMTELIADNNCGKSINLYDNIKEAPFYNSGISVLDTVAFGVTNQTYDNLNNSYDDLTSPYKSNIFCGYARGEVYRFGIVFYNKKNQPSFVKWIGDIKFPFNSSSDDLETDYSYFRYDYAEDKLYVRPLYLQFNIDLPSELRDEISGFSIVRTERKDEDKTKLGTALTGGLTKRSTNLFSWTDLKDFIVELIYQKVINLVKGGTSNIFLNWATNAFEDQIKEAIENSLSGLTAQLQELFVNDHNTEEDFKNILRSSLSTIGNQGGFPSGTSFLGIFGDAVIVQLIEYIFDEIKDYLKRKIGGLDNNVYTLEGSAYANAGEIDKTIYTIYPEQQFERYKYKQGDYIKVVSCFNDMDYTDLENSDAIVLINPYHRYKKTGFLNRTNSTAVYRKWLKGVLVDESDLRNINLITNQINFEKGQNINTSQLYTTTNQFTATISNSYIGYVERFDKDNNLIISDLFSKQLKVLGIGDKKHLITLDKAYIGIIDNLIGSSLNTYYIKDNQNYITSGLTNINDTNFLGLNTGLDVYLSGALSNYSVNNTNTTDLDNDAEFLITPSPWMLRYPRILYNNGDSIVSYERYVSNQYGGNTYAARSLNEYIEVCYINKSEITSSIEFECSKGDTYVGLYGATNYGYYFEAFPGYDKAIGTKKGLIDIFPAEASFNFNLREGRHANNSATPHDLNVTEREVKRKVRRARRKAKRTGIDIEQQLNNSGLNRRFIFDDFVYYEIYEQENNAKIYKAKPIIDIFTKESKARIWMSEKKFDGEFIDNWKKFKALDYIDLESGYGPIKELTTFKDNLLYFQPNGFGTVLTNETTAIQDTSGKNLTLASAEALSNYKYLSTETGCNHRFGVITTDSNVYWIDTLRKKIFKFGDGIEPISDTKGISSKLRTLCIGNLITEDKTLSDISYGVHGAYYPEHNTVFFTFLNQEEKLTDKGSELLPLNTTISYNLLLQEFESFHSFTPGMYLKTPNRLICENPNNKKQGYQIYKGQYNNIFGTLFPSYVTVLSNEFPQSQKVFNNLLLHSEVYDSNGNNLPNESVNLINCWNDYQNTGNITLIPNTNIRRRERKWYLQIPRDINNAGYSTLSKPRMVDNHLFIKLLFNNSNNKRLVLHDINTFFQESIT